MSIVERFFVLGLKKCFCSQFESHGAMSHSKNEQVFEQLISPGCGGASREVSREDATPISRVAC